MSVKQTRIRAPRDLLGAHVSARGGVHLAPGRGSAIGASAIQVFTKSPSRWREPPLDDAVCKLLRGELERSRLATVVAHDSYLINLASPDRVLSERSIRSFTAELRRSEALGITAVVSHPGNYMTGRSRGIRQNAEGYARCLEAVPGRVMVWVETTAGSGTALGSSFEELAELRSLIPEGLRERVAFCADTCHLYAAGYDLVTGFDEVWARWERAIGLSHLRCLHLNDSKTSLGSHRDRHELIAEGTLGADPFRRIMTDPRFEKVVKIIETPKGEEPEKMDRRMLARLRSYTNVLGAWF